jgi:hypothetical protein
MEAYFHVFLTSALDGEEWSASRPGRFTLRERDPGTHWIEGWVDPGAGLGTLVKRKIPSPYLPGPEPPIIQPVAQRYTIEILEIPGTYITWWLRLPTRNFERQ